MKFGYRKPSFKKSFKARTTGKWKRSIKRSINPFYGKKGFGLRNPKKYIYNKIYNRTSFDALKPLKKKSNKRINTNDNYKKEISIWKIILAIYTCGISLIFTGIHKKQK